MLKTIKSLSEYEQLYKEYVTEGHVRGYLNYFISKKNISAYINEEKIKYAVVDGTLFLFADQGNYYKMYFWRLTAKTKSLPDADKEICCDIYEQQNNNFTVNVLHQLFIENNYECKQKYEQVRLSYGNLHTISFKYLEENKWKLYENNMRIGTVSLNDKSEVEQLIVDYMGKYNKLSIEDEDWQEQIRNNNVVGIYVADNLIAVYYFTEKASRIVVGKNYRGQNLSVYLRMYFASQIRWAISSKNQYDWAEANNISTKITFAKLFAIYTGKIKYRYVKTI